MDTHAAVRQLEQAGASTALAEAMTQVLQDALGSTPTVLELRQFVLDQDVKLERLRGEMHQEFVRVHETMGRITTTLARLEERLTRVEAHLATPTRLAWAMVGLAAALVLFTVLQR